ncbi:glycosyltransferase family 2 protein [Chengkuizengella sp. SCS-71B]|uniref:glycosyltransferase family 2 protein n=1 Tax=Chengkuizengella sp. SCS-71B TaxID=3115290 RepID=UPI0032C23EB8
METQYSRGLVSVIIPTYKRANMLLRAVDSVLNQTYKNIEVLVVNDNEPGDEHTNDLKEILLKYTDERLNYIEQKKHVNGAVARNVGIKLAKGEYIAFLDDDDYWKSEKIEKQVNVLEELDNSWGGVACRKKFYLGGKLVKATLPYKDGYVFEHVLLRNIEITTGTLLMRREALDDAGYFDENLLRYQDVQLFAFLTQKYKIKLMQDFFLCAHIDDNSNRLNPQKLISAKKSFFNSVEPLMKSLPKRKKTRVYNMHQFDIGIAMIKHREFKSGLKMISFVFKDPVSTYYAVKKTLVKIVETKLRNFIV